MVIFCLIGGPVAAAGAVAYATASSPLYVSGYGSVARTYGNLAASRVSASQGKSYLSTAYYKYTDADNHTVFTILQTRSSLTGSYFYPESSHDNIVSNSWTAFRSRPTKTMSVRSGSDTITTIVGTCLDIPWRSDPCGTTNMLSIRI